jgi:hypothetical protein
MRFHLPRMRALIAVLCTLLLPLGAAAQPAATKPPAPGYELFPHDTPFRGPIADPAEPRVQMKRLHLERPGGGFAAAVAGLGWDFGLLRHQSEDPDRSWQLSLFGSADSIFNLDLPGDALVNTDYRLGLPLTWRNASYSTRLRVYHQSSHLGDELILGGNAPRRIELSFEVLDLLLAWDVAGWRFYGGANHVLRSSHDSYKGSGVHVGVDFVSAPALFGQRLTAGLDVKWIEQADWRSGAAAKAGIKFGRYALERRGVTLFYEAYEGFAPFGQFFVEDFSYRGITLQFDF